MIIPLLKFISKTYIKIWLSGEINEVWKEMDVYGEKFMTLNQSSRQELNFSCESLLIKWMKRFLIIKMTYNG